MQDEKDGSEEETEGGERHQSALSHLQRPGLISYVYVTLFYFWQLALRRSYSVCHDNPLQSIRKFGWPVFVGIVKESVKALNHTTLALYAMTKYAT